MKKTMFKDALRNIKKSFVSWLSVVIIACLAVSAYLGIRLSANSIRQNANALYERTAFRDVEVLSTLLISEDDIRELNGLEGVRAAVGIHRADTLFKVKDNEYEAILISYTEDVNRPDLFEGRYPTGRNECLLSTDLAEETGLRVGDILRLPENEYLKNNVFTITGIAVHPDHIAKKKETAGKRYIIITDDCFDHETYDNCYSAAEILLDKEEETDRFSDSYFSFVSEAEKEIDELMAQRAPIRRQQIIDRYQAEIDDKQKELDEVKRQLDEAATEIEKADKQIQAGRNRLSSSWSLLQSKKKELDEGKRQLDDAAAQLAVASGQLSDADSQLSSAKKQLAKGYEKILGYRDEIVEYLKDEIEKQGIEEGKDINWITSHKYNIDSSKLTLKKLPVAEGFTVDLLAINDLADRLAEWLGQYVENVPVEEIRAWVEKYQNEIDQIKKWEKGHKEYLANKDLYDEQYALYQSSLDQYNSGMAAYEEGLAQYNEGLAQYNSGRATLNYSIRQLEIKKEEYAEGLETYEEGRTQLLKAIEDLKNFPENRYVIMNVKGNASYLYARTLSGNFIDLSSTFSLLFVFVGALVIYATVGKNIDEQKKLVGTGKALGLFSSEIMSKYFSFGLSSTLMGVIVGILIAYFGIEKAMLGMEADFFHFRDIHLLFDPLPIVVAVVLALVLASIAVWLACHRLLKQPATRLIQGAVTDDNKRKKNKKRSHASLYTRLIFRNMRYDLKRVAVTVVSIAGSCALILIGLTISHSMSSAADIQFNEMYRYDYLINFDEDIAHEDMEKIETVLDKNATGYIKVACNETAFQNGDELDSALILIGDPEEIEEYHLLQDADTGETIKISDRGIYVPQKLNELSHYTDSGELRIYSGTMEPHDIKVNASFRCYIARFMIMSPEQYKATYGHEYLPDQYLIRITPDKAEAIREQIEDIPGVKEYMRSEGRMKSFESYISMAQGMVILLTVMAFMMAYFILLNLVNIFVNQKKKELTIMRINGFTVKEVKNYLGYEMIITTVLGVMLGNIIGVIIAYRMIILLEYINCFDRRIYIVGILIASLTTIVMSGAISMYSLRKVKNLKLSDI